MVRAALAALACLITICRAFKAPRPLRAVPRRVCAVTTDDGGPELTPALELRGGGVDLPRTKPKPVAVELSIDVAIFCLVQIGFRSLSCANAKTCSLGGLVTAARTLFAVSNAVALAIFIPALRYARGLPTSAVVAEDIAAMDKRLKKTVMKVVVLAAIHIKVGLMAPLVASSLITWVAMPIWWDKESSYYRKYGLGRRTGV
mmetsp:Transcript_32754/g.98745  ORF Transcript_32754/g.98745 Transcript_32754/m.98745 type:complete len:202 (-) Transcript_32754:124-729(-)